MKTVGKFILDDDNLPVEETDLHKWAEWFEHAGKKRIVAQDQIGPYFVSTVFLAIDYNYGNRPYPILWETMVFCDGDENDETSEFFNRFESRKDAEVWHQNVINKLKERV